MGLRRYERGTLFPHSTENSEEPDLLLHFDDNRYANLKCLRCRLL